ncbi:MAG: hypothetical protein KAG19_00780 [Methylococcales bacterium]|nr:hypothetical protein [Methylococcales bacterium]
MNISHVISACVINFSLLAGNAIAAPYTSVPSEPSYNFSAQGKGNSTYSFTFWRESLLAGGSKVLMKVRSNDSAEILVCGKSFSLLQNGKQFNGPKLDTGDSSKTCNVLSPDESLAFDLSAVTQEFDERQGFSVLYNKARFKIPAQVGAAFSSSATVSNNLDLSIPSATYGNMNLWVNLTFSGVDAGGDYVWKLKGYGENQ